MSEYYQSEGDYSVSLGHPSMPFIIIIIMMVMKLTVLIGGEVFSIITVPCGFLSPLSLISSKPITIITNCGNLITTTENNNNNHNHNVERSH